jgi:hypothetical protein
MYLSCRCLLTFLLMAFLSDCTISTQPTVLSLRTVGDACLSVPSELHHASRCCWNRARRLTCFLSASVTRKFFHFGTWIDPSFQLHYRFRPMTPGTAPPRKFCRIALLCFLFDYITVTAPVGFLSKSQTKIQINNLYPPSGILRLNVDRIFCLRGSANMLLLSCPNLSCPILITSLRLPLRSTIVSFIQALSLCYVSHSPHTSSTQILYLTLCRHCWTICQTGDVRSSSVSLVF